MHWGLRVYLKNLILQFYVWKKSTVDYKMTVY